MSIDVIFKEAQEASGIEGLTLNEQGYCSLEVEQEYEVLLSYDMQQEQLNLCATLLIMPDDIATREWVFGVLMASHAFGKLSLGSHFAFDDKRDLIVQFKSLPLERLTGKALLEHVEGFTSTLKHWRQTLQQRLSEHEQVAAPSVPPLQTAQFLRV